MRAKHVVTLICSVLALASLGVALLMISPHMVSNCDEAITGPFTMVAGGCLAYATFGMIGFRKNRRAGFLLLVGTAALILAQDWLVQKTLPNLLLMDCPAWTIR